MQSFGGHQVLLAYTAVARLKGTIRIDHLLGSFLLDGPDTTSFDANKKAKALVCLGGSLLSWMTEAKRSLVMLA